MNQSKKKQPNNDKILKIHQVSDHLFHIWFQVIY